MKFLFFFLILNIFTFSTFAKPKHHSRISQCLDSADIDLPYSEANLAYILTFDYVKTQRYINRHLQGTDTKIGFIKQRIGKVFTEKGLIEDKHLSYLNRNKNRRVFRDPKNPKTLYTMDTQHCAIEVFDSKGRHQGEVNFDFEFMTKDHKKDKGRGHDIITR